MMRSLDVVVSSDGGVTAADREMTPEEVANLPVTPPPPRMRRIAPLAFQARIGDAAMMQAMVTAAQDLRADPPSAQAQLILNKMSAARFIDLDDPATEMGLQYFVGRGIIDAANLPALLADGQPGEGPA